MFLSYIDIKSNLPNKNDNANLSADHLSGASTLVTRVYNSETSAQKRVKVFGGNELFARDVEAFVQAVASFAGSVQGRLRFPLVIPISALLRPSVFCCRSKPRRQAVEYFPLYARSPARSEVA